MSNLNLLLNYFVDQYREFCNPADFCERSMRINLDEDEDIKKARAALDEVNEAIRAYEKERTRLEEESKLDGVKGLAAKNLLAQLMASPLAEKLAAALIKAEAAVRLATKKATEAALKDPTRQTSGNVWWMNREMALQKERYGRKG